MKIQYPGNKVQELKPNAQNPNIINQSKRKFEVEGFYFVPRASHFVLVLWIYSHIASKYQTGETK